MELLIDDDESKRTKSLVSKSPNTKNAKSGETAYKAWETVRKKKVRHRNELSDSSNKKKQIGIF